MDKLKTIIAKIISKENRWLFAGTIILGLIIGLFFGGGSERSSSVDLKNETSEVHDHSKEQIWTCSMHPQIRQPKPGKCPLCGMDLIPASSGEDSIGVRSLKLSANAIKLAEVRVEPVERKYVSTNVRMVGKVEYDETRLGYITSRVPGRIDRLFVNFTGTNVRKGDHLVRMYSPELITAQQELIQSSKAFQEMSGNISTDIQLSLGKTLFAVREKLRLWGLTSVQIKNIELSGKPEDHLTIYSPMGGIVIEKNAVEGIYVNTGMKIYSIADLSHVWVKLDAYESDLPWIRYGQKIEFESEAYPGEVFKGKIAFIDPVLNPTTRTVKIRVNLKNPGNKLKPNMFVKAVIHSKLSESGKVMDPDLAGKWISPMHPEIVKNRPGKCDVCGMPLVKAEDLGYLSSEETQKSAPLVIPSSAPLITGTRAVVYVEVKGEAGVFEGREVILGPRAGDYYLVKEGLKEGEMVVVNGAFKIDSDLQIQAKPSMMNPEGSSPVPGHDHGDHGSSPPKKNSKGHIQKEVKRNIPHSFQKSVNLVTNKYFDLQDSLSRDSLKNSKINAAELIKNLEHVDMNLLQGESHLQWMKLEKVIKIESKKLSNTSDINSARKQFKIITKAVTEVVKVFGTNETNIFRFHCPMAFDNKGAFWLQKNKDTRNPYFGESMLLCNDSIEKVVSKKKDQE